MRRFVADFTRNQARIDVPLARAYGPSLGITAKRFLDIDADTIDMQGTVVPANALNSLIGKIPLVGFLITGGQRGGIGSVTYRATGKPSQPSFRVNPLSAVEAGFERSST
jgi:hypothetical protein